MSEQFLTEAMILPDGKGRHEESREWSELFPVHFFCQLKKTFFFLDSKTSVHIETPGTWIRLLQMAESTFLFRCNGDAGKSSPHIY